MQVVHRKIQLKPKKRWIGLAFLTLVWLLTWSLFKDFSRVRKGFSRIDSAQNRLTQAQRESWELSRKLAAVQTEYYKEKLMRDKLNMHLPGETIVVLPEIGEVEDGELGTEDGNEENWEKWWGIIK